MAKFLMRIDNILSKDECDAFIFLVDNSKLHYIDSASAQYHRLVYDNKKLASILYTRLKHLIPVESEGCPVVGLNRVFRLSKYFPKDSFKTHKDGYNKDSDAGTYSSMTLNIFLNDNFEGGETDFFTCKDRNKLRYSMKPAAGRGALFDSQQYHCGNEVVKGVKYLLRTDVMIKGLNLD